MRLTEWETFEAMPPGIPVSKAWFFKELRVGASVAEQWLAWWVASGLVKKCSATKNKKRKEEERHNLEYIRLEGPFLTPTDEYIASKGRRGHYPKFCTGEARWANEKVYLSLEEESRQFFQEYHRDLKALKKTRSVTVYKKESPRFFPPWECGDEEMAVPRWQEEFGLIEGNRMPSQLFYQGEKRSDYA